MALDLATFRLSFPEFDPVADAWVEATIDQSEYLVSDTWSADERDQIVALQVAATLARSPAGRHAQLASKDGESVYSRELAARKRRHSCLLSRLG